MTQTMSSSDVPRDVYEFAMVNRPPPPVRADVEGLVLEHLGAGYNLARWFLRNPHDAEDAVQDACIRALQGIGGLCRRQRQGVVLDDRAQRVPDAHAPRGVAKSRPAGRRGDADRSAIGGRHRAGGVDAGRTCN